MVKDPETLKRLRSSWQTVRTIEARISTTLNTHIFSLAVATTGFSVVPESLLLVFALSVMEDALRQLRDEGVFVCRRNELALLMVASRVALPWRDFDKADSVRARRNRVAHRREFLAPGQCAVDLDAIARELVAWGVLDRDERVTSGQGIGA